MSAVNLILAGHDIGPVSQRNAAIPDTAFNRLDRDKINANDESVGRHVLDCNLHPSSRCRAQIDTA